MTRIEPLAIGSRDDPGRVRTWSYCRFCEALCGIVVETEGQHVLSVKGDPDDPVSHGYTCPKGRALPAWHHHPKRLTTPMMRNPLGDLEPVTWPHVLEDLADRIEAIIRRQGPDGIGLYNGTGAAFDASGRRMGERWHRMIGSRNKYSSSTIDAPGKPYVAELVAGHPGVVPAPDRENPGILLLVGVNPVASHGHLSAFPDPVTTLRELARKDLLWVIDPRQSESALLANGHIAPRPGTDYAVLAFLIRELLRDGADLDYLAQYASGVEELRAVVEPFDLKATVSICDVDAAAVEGLLAAIRRRGKVAGQSGTGTAMSIAANVTEWMLWSLQIVTASLDRPGGSWCHPGFLRALEGRQLEARDGTAEPGPASRPDLRRRLGEYPVVAMYDEIEAGNMSALLVAGGNPMSAFPDRSRTEKVLSQLEVLAVIDVVGTATSDMATHILPAAGQLERADLPHFIDQFLPTITTRYTAAVVPPVGESRPMWWTFASLGERMGIDVLGGGRKADETTDNDLLRELGDRSRAGSFDRLVEDRIVIHDPPQMFGWVHQNILPGGRWRLAPAPLVEQLAKLSRSQHQPGTVLIPMRQLRHLNSQLADGVGLVRPDEGVVHVNTDDAERLGIDDGAMVMVTSATGSLTGVARVGDLVRRGVVAVPHGYADPHVGELTTTATDVDPLTGMVLMSGVRVDLARVGAG